MSDDAKDFIQAARRIRLAESCADVASALMLAVLTGTPRDQREWRRRSAARTAAVSCLRGLELTLMQRSASSPELASDLRIATRKSLERILRPVSKLDAVDLFRFADMAVASIATLAGATDVLKPAAEKCDGRICAWLTLGGSLFVPARATEYAEKKGLKQAKLEELLRSAGEPLRKACAASVAARVGQLHARRDHEAFGLSLRATLDASSTETPVICIELAELTQPETLNFESTTETDESQFSARLLRVLVS